MCVHMHACTVHACVYERERERERPVHSKQPERVQFSQRHIYPLKIISASHDPVLEWDIAHVSEH